MSLAEQIGGERDVNAFIDAMFPQSIGYIDPPQLEILRWVASADFTKSAEHQAGGAKRITLDLDGLEEEPLEVYTEILLFRISQSSTPITSELRLAVIAALSAAVFDRLRSLLSDLHEIDSRVPGDLGHINPSIHDSETIGDVLLRLYAQLSPQERIALDHEIKNRPEALLENRTYQILRETVDRKWERDSGPAFVASYRNASGKALRSELKRSTGKLLPLTRRTNQQAALESTEPSSAHLLERESNHQKLNTLDNDRIRPLVEGVLVLASQRVATLPPTWRTSLGHLDHKRLLNRMEASLSHAVTTQHDLHSTARLKNDTISMIAAFAATEFSPDEMAMPEGVTPQAWLEALESQELELAFHEIRNPSDPESLAQAGSFVRAHIADRLLQTQEGGTSPVPALRSFEEELGRFSAFLREWPESAIQESSPEQLDSQQNHLKTLRSLLESAQRTVDERLVSLAEITAQKEGEQKGFMQIGASELRRGVELIETARRKNVACIVVRRGPLKERAMLRPFNADMSYDKEVPSNELYARGGKLVRRAFSGEHILIRDGNSGAPLALMEPLSADAEEYWSKHQ